MGLSKLRGWDLSLRGDVRRYTLPSLHHNTVERLEATSLSLPFFLLAAEKDVIFQVGSITPSQASPLQIHSLVHVESAHCPSFPNLGYKVTFIRKMGQARLRI
jgi:hypothetical protein